MVTFNLFTETEDYKIEWHDAQGECHVHCLVYNWKPSILKKLYVEYAKLKSFLGSIGYEYFCSVTPNPKFCELFGGEFLGYYNGKEVMIWETQ